MPSFFYIGRDFEGEFTYGTIHAPNSEFAIDALAAKGITSIDVIEGYSDSFLLNLFGLVQHKVTEEDILFFSRQMHTLIKAGVPILQALSGLRNTASSPAFYDLLGRLRQNLDMGHELSVAMKETERFDDFYISMIRVGEMTGQLDSIFLRLFEHLVFQKQIRMKIRAVLRYPLFVAISIIAALIVIHTFIIPTFAKVFHSFNAPLPLITQILIEISNFVVHDWYLIIIALGMLILGVRGTIQLPEGRLFWDEKKLKLPIIGTILHKAALARFSRSFALSFRSGVPIMEIFDVVGEVVDNWWIKERLQRMRFGLRYGKSPSQAAEDAEIFSPVVLQMIAVGEESGDLDVLLQEVAEMYEREIEYDINALSTHIEPLLVLALGIIVLIMAMGVFAPIWSMSSAIIQKH